MAIRVVYKSIRQNNSTNWYNRDGNSWRDHSAFNAISKRVNSSNPSTFLERTHPDDLTIITSVSWPDLSTYNAAVGDYDEANNITTIRYIYDASNNLTSTQRRVRKVYWEDYSE